MLMRQIFSLLIFLLLLAPRSAAQDKYTVSWDYGNTSFREFVEKAESTLPVRFFFRDEWIEGLIVPRFRTCLNLTCILENLFRGTALFFKIDDAGNIIITKEIALEVSREKAKTGYRIPSSTAFADSVMRQQKTQILNLEIGRRSDAGLPGNVSVTGTVTDAASGEPLPGVTIYIEKMKAGAVTNTQGWYFLSLPRGDHNLRFSFIGMQETRVTLKLYGAGEMNIRMKGILIPLGETVISAERNIVLHRFESGIEKISVPELKMLPAFLGETDIIKSLLLVTGVQSAGEGSAGFSVRGGSADQNLILLDNATVYNYSHSFGFFSAFNSEVLKEATLYKGGIPPKFGGRISSILDISTRDGNKNDFAGNAGIGPLTAHLTLEGPLRKDTLSYLFAGRATYSDWLLGMIKNNSIKNSKAFFYDLNGKLSWSPDRNNRISLITYMSHDRFAFASNTLYEYGNKVLGLNWKHFWNSRFYSVFSLSNTNFNYNIHQNAVPGEEYIMTHRINTTSLKADFNHFEGMHELNYGLDLNYHNLLPGSYLPGNDSSNIASSIMQKENAVEGALYADDRIRISDWLSAEAGLRYSVFSTFGPRTVLFYNTAYPKSPSTVTGNRNFEAGKIVQSYSGPEIRASLNFRLGSSGSFKVNYNRTRQYIHLLSNSAAVSPTDSWKLCDSYLKPEYGDQYAAGFYQLFFKKKVEASAEVYYKDIRDMADFKSGTMLTLVENIEQDLVPVRGKAYGLELSLKKTEGRMRYNIGYTWSRTFARSTGLFRDEVINDGNWYPSSFDQPHDLFITAHYLYSRRLSFTAGYTYITGRPVTYPVSKYSFYNMTFIHWSDRNRYRMPYYSRLDLSVKINGKLKLKRLAHPYWNISVYNLLARKNAYSVYFVRRYDMIKGYQLSIFGTAIPSVTFGFDF